MDRNSSYDRGSRMPALFIGHGSPMNMVQANSFTKSLAELGRSLPRPDAIMVISAHWLTRGTFVTCAVQPRLIYDFYGFPEELYRVKYECSGSPHQAGRVKELGAGAIECDYEWGFDHASYSVLRHMYPAADIPVFEMSLDYVFGERDEKTVQNHYDLGKKLRALRDEGVLIIGSGNMVHNLRIIDFSDSDAGPFGWAAEADEMLRSHLVSGRHQDLIRYPFSGGNALYAVPTLDHYLPMIAILGLREREEELRFTHESFQNGSLSMRCFRIG